MESTRATRCSASWSPLAEMEPDAAAAAREKVAVLHTTATLRLFDLLADRLRAYLARYGAGTAAERGAARQAVEPQLPRRGWMQRVLALAPLPGLRRHRDRVRWGHGGRLIRGTWMAAAE